MFGIIVSKYKIIVINELDKYMLIFILSGNLEVHYYTGNQYQ